MKVKEFIAALKKCPQDLEVGVYQEASMDDIDAGIGSAFVPVQEVGALWVLRKEATLYRGANAFVGEREDVLQSVFDDSDWYEDDGKTLVQELANEGVTVLEKSGDLYEAIVISL